MFVQKISRIEVRQCVTLLWNFQSTLYDLSNFGERVCDVAGKLLCSGARHSIENCRLSVFFHINEWVRLSWVLYFQLTKVLNFSIFVLCMMIQRRTMSTMPFFLCSIIARKSKLKPIWCKTFYAIWNFSNVRFYFLLLKI